MDIVVDRSAIKASDRGAINDTRIRVTPLVRILFISFVWIEILGLANSSYAQTPAPRTEAAKTLTEQLLAEGANSLAVAARERGDAVRGAILFSQQTLACAGCHAQGAKDLLGPDLTVVSAKMTDEHFVESILLPSKVIGKGFESVKVLTIDGRVVTGRMVDDSDDHVVIRELAGTRNLTRITKDQIDRIGQDAASAMPEKLADHLADRQQFLDLVKYVIDIAGTNANIDLGGAGGPSIGTIDKHIQGLSLLDHFGCINCHATHSDALAGANALPQKRGPILDGVTNRVDPAYIRRFIASPQTVKRGTSMPNVIGHLDDARRDEVAAAITAYLVSRSSQSFERQAIDSEAAGRGQELFHTVGCVACHSPRDDQGRETMTQDSVALGDVGAKHNLAGLTSFLEDPHSIRPEGRMPNMTLSHWEAQDLANYLMQFGEPLSATSIEVNESTAALGKQLFEKFGCSQCHRADSGENPNVALPSNAVGNASGNASHNRYPSLAELDPMRGCLSAQAGSWPRFQIDDSQIDAIRTAIGSLSEPLGDRQRVVLTMETLRCFACHRRDDLGGISDERDVFFHTTNENLGPQGRIPPSLTGVGGKLKQKWLRDVLVNGRSIRPYMNTRMPQFGLANVEPLMDLFPKLDPKPLVEYVDPGDLKETKTIGTDLVGNQGLNCIACHTFAMQPAQTMPAVDLTEMAERLNKEWFIQYMYAPQVLNPGTVMPSFWPGGKAIRKEIADGDSNRQIDAIWEYLSDGRQAREPRGLRREPITLLAGDDHAVMLRRSYREIGKRGIGVGYPGKVNLAFDAEQMRLAMIWKGDFADPGGVWRSQGHGTVRPLGDQLIHFQLGPDLDDNRSPWKVDNGRPPNHQFTGYFLDDFDRPTFTYRFDNVDVQDYAIDQKDTSSGKTTLKRTIHLAAETPHDDLVFRIANGGNVEQVDAHTFRIDKTLTVRVASGHAPQILDTETGKRLVIPLNLPSGSTELEIHYAW